MATGIAAQNPASPVTAAPTPMAAPPVTMGVRALFDRYRSKALTGRRVQGRIQRLQELNRFIRKEEKTEEAAACSVSFSAEEPLQAAGQVE